METLRIFPLRVAVRKMSANVAECGSAQQGVANCMGQGIAVGMADGTAVEGHFNPTQHQFPAGNQAMKIVADAGAAQCAPTAWVRSCRR